MRKLAITLLVSSFVLGTVTAGNWEKHGTNYETKTAAEKHDALWKEITAN